MLGVPALPLTLCALSSACRFVQVEARLRQLEGKLLATEGAKPKGKEQPGKYDKSKQGAAAGVATQARAYNADADAPAPAVDGKKEKKEKKEKKRAAEENGTEEEPAAEAAAEEPAKKKSKKDKKEKAADEGAENGEAKKVRDGVAGQGSGRGAGGARA